MGLSVFVALLKCFALVFLTLCFFVRHLLVSPKFVARNDLLECIRKFDRNCTLAALVVIGIVVVWVVGLLVLIASCSVELILVDT